MERPGCLGYIFGERGYKAIIQIVLMERSFGRLISLDYNWKSTALNFSIKEIVLFGSDVISSIYELCKTLFDNFKSMNQKLFLTIILFVSILISVRGQTNKADHSKQAIICLTYDDGLETQLSTVIPQLDSVGLKATFFLNSIQGSAKSDIIGQTPEAVLGWTNAAKNGHELANHTLFHACPENLGWDKSVSIETYTVNKIVTEIKTNNIILSLLDPNRKERSFSFPCNNSLIGDTDYTTIIKNQGLVKYARTGGDSNSIITDFKNLNIMKVPSWHVWTGTTLNQLIAFAEKVRNAKGMGIYQFHGVGGQVFKISGETHRAFLAYLKTHQDEYWVTTFSEAMDYITSK
jgi:peptidoglycan/xylan/chitin deacetylase (PgdA/CDA1 family)